MFKKIGSTPRWTEKVGIESVVSKAITLTTGDVVGKAMQSHSSDAAITCSQSYVFANH